MIAVSFAFRNEMDSIFAGYRCLLLGHGLESYGRVDAEEMET